MSKPIYIKLLGLCTFRFGTLCLIIIVIIIIIVRGEFLSLSVWYCDTLLFGCILSFLKKRIFGPFYFSFLLIFKMPVL